MAFEQASLSLLGLSLPSRPTTRQIGFGGKAKQLETFEFNPTLNFERQMDPESMDLLRFGLGTRLGVMGEVSLVHRK